MDIWNNPNIVSNLSAISQIIVATFGILALILGFRLSHLQDQETQRREVKIEEAKQSASQANEKAAAANERAALLEKEASVAKLELAKLNEKYLPWQITEGETRILIEKLKPFSKYSIRIDCTQLDGARASIFAKKLKEVFENAGYQVHREIGILGNATMEGLFLYSSESAGIQLHELKDILSPFADIGINSKYYIYDERSEPFDFVKTDLVLRVGSKSQVKRLAN